MTEYVKIRCDDCKFGEECGDYGWEMCKKFTPIPKQPQTNFQRITESEEVLAEFIVKACMIAEQDQACSLLDVYKRAMSTDYKLNVFLTKELIEWLKQESE